MQALCKRDSCSVRSSASDHWYPMIMMLNLVSMHNSVRGNKNLGALKTMECNNLSVATAASLCGLNVPECALNIFAEFVVLSLWQTLWGVGGSVYSPLLPQSRSQITIVEEGKHWSQAKISRHMCWITKQHAWCKTGVEPGAPAFRHTWEQTLNPIKEANSPVHEIRISLYRGSVCIIMG